MRTFLQRLVDGSGRERIAHWDWKAGFLANDDWPNLSSVDAGRGYPLAAKASRALLDWTAEGGGPHMGCCCGCRFYSWCGPFIEWDGELDALCCGDSARYAQLRKQLPNGLRAVYALVYLGKIRVLASGAKHSETICTKFCHRAVDGVHSIENTWVAGGEFWLTENY